MKKLLYGVILAGLALAGPAQALNLRQNQDGTADWMGSDARSAAPVGSHAMIVNITGTTSNSTVMLISPLSNAIIKDVIVGKQGAGAGSATVTVTVDRGQPVRMTTPMSQFSDIVGGPTPAVVLIGDQANVSSYRLTQINTITRGRFLFNSLQLGDPILVNLNGGQTTAATATIILMIAPK